MYRMIVCCIDLYRRLAALEIRTSFRSGPSTRSKHLMLSFGLPENDSTLPKLSPGHIADRGVGEIRYEPDNYSGPLRVEVR
jgi:hypothetical protein